jgi:hypothetical protein
VKFVDVEETMRSIKFGLLRKNENLGIHSKAVDLRPNTGTSILKLIGGTA